MQAIEDVIKSLKSDVPSFVQRDMEWLSESYEIYIADNVSLAFNIFKEQGSNESRNKMLDLQVGRYLSAAKHNAPVNSIRMYGILSIYYLIFSLTLKLNTLENKDEAKKCIYDVHQILLNMTSWSEKLKKILYFDDVCASFAERIFKPKLLNKNKSGNDNNIQCNNVATLQRSIVGFSGEINVDNAQQILLQFSLPKHARPKCLWGKVISMSYEINELYSQLEMISFFQKHISSYEALTELLMYKKRSMQHYINYLPDIKLQQLYLDTARIHVGVNRNRSDKSHILQNHEAWFVEHLLHQIHGRGLHVPTDINTNDTHTIQSHEKKCRLFVGASNGKVSA